MTTQVQVIKDGDKFTFSSLPEILEQIGVTEGESFDVTADENAVVLRRRGRAELEARVDEIVHDLIVKRQSAYEKLAEGAGGER